ncbi:MAG: BlaI/MecI/CopY family transcriptional regulator [Bacteroidales bacterium]|nr:BlaI/MecI/CopY family transcriptional regulator [Bacteroidales bacterium]
MEKLTKKEEEIMEFFWDKGPLFVKEILDLYPEPKPHFNTVSTMVRILETKGYVNHKVYGNTHQYFATVDKKEFGHIFLKDVINKFFGNSYKNAVSALVSDEEISPEDLKDLLNDIENDKN